MKFQSNISPQNMHLIQLIIKTQNTYLIYIYIYIYTHTPKTGVLHYTPVAIFLMKLSTCYNLLSRYMVPSSPISSTLNDFIS